MQNPNEQLKAMSVTELESLAYRQLVTIENAQSALKLINQTLVEKSQEKPQEEAPVKAEKIK